MEIKNKIALITGGEGPLGRAVSKKFLAEGVKLAIGWYAQDEWDEAKESISAYKGQFIDMRVDVSKEENVEELVKKAKDTFGSIDILLYMAGAFLVGPMLWETDTATFNRLVDVNLKGAFLCSKHVVKVMLEKKQGRIVFFPAKFAIEPKPHFGAYAVSKVGLITLMEALREELKETDITINSVMPDAIDTWRTRNTPNAQPDKWVKTSDIANLLHCICSSKCDILNGSILKTFGKI
jgi:NAD(P)-dependent dehydrogenase (short-subunit alcohol dehydrogenase family)